jgi:hypothetical protein
MSLNSYPWTSYQQTHVEAYLPEGVKVLAQVDGDEVGSWPFDETEVWILTACNPRSQELSPDENNQRHKALGAQLSELGLNYFYTRGFDPTLASSNEWSEDGYGVVGNVGKQVLELAKTWEQNAVFVWRPSEWVILGVLIEGQTKSGWRYI